MTARRYFAITLGTALILALGIGFANWTVDPLALRDSGKATLHNAAAALPAVLPSDSSGNYWQKVYAVTRLRPASVILGTSRAETGLDEAHPGFASGAPAYNLALGGLSIDQMRLLLIHAQRTRALKQVVIGLDLESFLDSGRGDFDPAVLTGVKESEAKWLSTLRLNLSWRATAATVARLRSPENETESATENTTARIANTRITRARWQELQGQRGLFYATEFHNFQSRLPLLVFAPTSNEVQWRADSRRAAAMRGFRELLSFARAEGIDLRLFISPVHARYLEWYRRVGWWPLFDAWRRELVDTLADEAKAGAGTRTRNSDVAFPLWDFSGFNRISTEEVPRLGDIEASMQWYIESSHYTREHGKLILDRVLGGAGAQPPAEGDYGKRIDKRTIEAWLDQSRFDAYRFRTTFPMEVEEIGKFVSLLRRNSRR
jgi:hypothetical protein